MGLMTGKKGVVFGVANDKSIAWGIAQQLHAAGAELAFTYLNEPLEKRVRPLAESLDAQLILPCDVQNEEEIAAVYARIAEEWGKIDFIVHAIAFANRDDLKQPFSQTSREGFRLALDVSAYSLVSLTRHALPVMNQGGAILAMSYLGAVRSVPAYNVMGVAKAALESSVRYLAAELGEQQIRVNAISAGPIKTLAASGIGGFKEKLRIAEERSPLQRLVTQEDVGKSALYLLSDLASGVTGEVHYVDCGFSTAAG